MGGPAQPDGRVPLVHHLADQAGLEQPETLAAVLLGHRQPQVALSAELGKDVLGPVLVVIHRGGQRSQLLAAEPLGLVTNRLLILVERVTGHNVNTIHRRRHAER